MRNDDYLAWLMFVVWAGAFLTYAIFMTAIFLVKWRTELLLLGVTNTVALVLLNWYRLSRYT